MKLRLTDDSIRFRVSPTEVSALVAGNKLGTLVRFGPLPDQHFSCTIEQSSSHPEVFAIYSQGTISVTLPQILINGWAGTDRVAIEARQSVGDNAFLKILVEKDFQCLHPRSNPDEGEDETDRFANPGALTTA